LNASALLVLAVFLIVTLFTVKRVVSTSVVRVRRGKRLMDT